MRVKTGIPGMDELLEGGFPERTVNLVCGPAGSGKSLFAMQYACGGDWNAGERSAILTLEERLCSRFEGGLIADIQSPDLETRIAILQFKRTPQPILVSDQIIEYIAQRFISNVRELEGALNRVVAEAMSERQPLTIELAAIALQSMVINRNRILRR